MACYSGQDDKNNAQYISAPQESAAASSIGYVQPESSFDHVVSHNDNNSFYLTFTLNSLKNLAARTPSFWHTIPIVAEKTSLQSNKNEWMCVCVCKFQINIYI